MVVAQAVALANRGVMLHNCRIQKVRRAHAGEMCRKRRLCAICGPSDSGYRPCRTHRPLVLAIGPRFDVAARLGEQIVIALDAGGGRNGKMDGRMGLNRFQVQHRDTTNAEDREVPHNDQRPTEASLCSSSGSSYWLAALPPCAGSNNRWIRSPRPGVAAPGLSLNTLTSGIAPCGSNASF